MIPYRILALAWLLWHATPEIDRAGALVHASHAVAFETPLVSAEMILAVVYVESRFDPTAVSIVPWANAYGFCGVMQTIAPTRAACVAQRELDVGYALGVRELETWLADPRVHGDTRRMLLGHGCGNAGLVHGRCGSHYPERVLAFRRLLEAR